MKKFKFTGKLGQDEISILKECINKTVEYLALESIHLKITPDILLETPHSCCLRLNDLNEPGQNINVGLFSQNLFEPALPILGYKQLVVKYSRNSSRSLSEKIRDLNPDIPDKYVCHISYPDRTPVSRVQVYGYREWSNIRSLDPELTLEDVKELGYKDFPDVESDSTDIIAMQHESGLMTCFILQQVGFRVELTTTKTMDQVLSSFTKSERLVLYHDISN